VPNSSAQGNALGMRPPKNPRAPTVCDTVARRTTPPRIAALQAAYLLASPTQGVALGMRPTDPRAPTGRDTVARETTPPRIAALQAANLSAFPTQGVALRTQGVALG